MRAWARVAALATLFALLAAAPAGAESTLTLTGQVHPAFELEIYVNGELAALVTPTDRVKVFNKDVPAPLARSGDNALAVRYRVRDTRARAPWNGSFRVSVRHAREKLVTLRGPDAPFPQAGSEAEVATRFALTLPASR